MNIVDYKSFLDYPKYTMYMNVIGDGLGEMRLKGDTVNGNFTFSRLVDLNSNFVPLSGETVQLDMIANCTWHENIVQDNSRRFAILTVEEIESTIERMTACAEFLRVWTKPKGYPGFLSDCVIKEALNTTLKVETPTYLRFFKGRHVNLVFNHKNQITSWREPEDTDTAIFLVMEDFEVDMPHLNLIPVRTLGEFHRITLTPEAQQVVDSIVAKDKRKDIYIAVSGGFTVRESCAK